MRAVDAAAAAPLPPRVPSRRPRHRVAAMRVRCWWRARDWSCATRCWRASDCATGAALSGAGCVHTLLIYNLSRVFANTHTHSHARTHYTRYFASFCNRVAASRRVASRLQNANRANNAGISLRTRARACQHHSTGARATAHPTSRRTRARAYACTPAPRRRPLAHRCSAQKNADGGIAATPISFVRKRQNAQSRVITGAAGVVSAR